MTDYFTVIALVPSAPKTKARELLDGVEVIRYRYAPNFMETLVSGGGIVGNLNHHRWKFLLVPGFVLAQIWHVWQLTRKRHVAAVHAHWLLPQGLAAVLTRGKAKRWPVLVTSHGADLFALKGVVFTSLKRYVVDRASALTVVSRAMKEQVMSLGADVGKVSVMPMGVDMKERFTPQNTSERSSSEILFVGRLVEKKGVRYLIEALPSVLTSNPAARLTLAGFGPEEQALRQLVRELALDDVVTFFGPVSQSQLPALYRRAAVFCAPFIEAASGDQEGLGLVVVEAIACGCPVVVSDLPATRDIGQSDEGFLRVPPMDVQALKSALLEVLTNSATHRRGALAMRECLKGRFDWDAVSVNYADLLRTHMNVDI